MMMADSACSVASGAAVWQQVVPVVEQVPLARDTYRLRLRVPEMARTVRPGQFFMIRAPHTTQPLLGRPFALYDTWLDAAGQPAGIDVVYLVVGAMTRLMSTWTGGTQVELWGPLGNGFPRVEAERLVMVAGGIGNTPFPAVARQALGLRRYGPHDAADSNWSPLTRDRITFCYGTRSAEYLAGVDEFQSMGIDVHLATDDGSQGHKGFVTDLVSRILQASEKNHGRGAGTPDVESGSSHGHPAHSSSATERMRIYCCGPEPMMHAVAKLAAAHAVPCWLSLETPMACGFGACFSCVTRVRQEDGTWDYRRTCVEGPIFPADRLAW
ncbi:MAG: dihydroorotate dehydrogenase electron transfer subunit [Planctomycetales bacterium]